MTSTRPWLRLYRETVRDRKLKRLTAEQRWLWVVLLCLTNDDGVVQVAGDIGYTMDELANEADIDNTSSVADALEWFQLAQMIRKGEGGVLEIVHWTSRQFKTDSSAKRTRKWRVKQESEGGDGDVTSQDSESDVTVTDQNRAETETETETDRAVADAPPPSPAGPDDQDEPLSDLLTIWNEAADRVGMVLTKPETILRPSSAAGKKRRRAALARLREHPDLDDWRTVIERIAGRNHCRGGSDSGWRADLEYLTRPDTFEAHLTGRWARGSTTRNPADAAADLPKPWDVPGIREFSGDPDYGDFCDAMANEYGYDEPWPLTIPEWRVAKVKGVN